MTGTLFGCWPVAQLPVAQGEWGVGLSVFLLGQFHPLSDNYEAIVVRGQMGKVENVRSLELGVKLQRWLVGMNGDNAHASQVNYYLLLESVPDNKQISNRCITSCNPDPISMDISTGLIGTNS